MTTDANPRIIDVPGAPKPKQTASAAPREQGNWWEPQNTSPSFSPPPIKPPPPTKTYTQTPPPQTRTYTQPPPVPPQRPSAAAYEQPRPTEKSPAEKPSRVKEPKIKPPISEQERLINKLSAASTAVVLIVIIYSLASHYYNKWKNSFDLQEILPYASQTVDSGSAAEDDMAGLINLYKDERTDTE